MGFIDYNLSDYLNRTETIKRVLKEYDSKNRLDNSYLKVKLSLSEMSLDPVDKPTTSPLKLQQSENEKTPPASISSSSENFKQQQQTTKHGFCSPTNSKTKIENIQMNSDERAFTPTHSRNSSKGSTVSFAERGHQRLVSIHIHLFSVHLKINSFFF